ncbi:hypothetical protein [Promicromonospora sp. NPDC023987]|uniref:hypothetical protein n=1 Tax=Promicromonospora sp. NPDC023987 TaxID=3155360 RepID=UPI00340B1BC1
MHFAIAAEPGALDRRSEDSTATTPGLLVLLDGATARTETGCIHGVAWFAQHLADAIVQELQGNASGEPAHALAAAIQRTADLHRDTCDLTHPGTPSAAVAIVHVAGDALRYLVLGDVTVVMETASGIRVTSDQRVSQTASAERAVADAMAATDPEKPAALVRMKHAELAARNVPDGYWVATTDPDAARHAMTGEVQLEEVRQVAVLSDGAARVVDLFGIHDWPGVLELLQYRGPEALIREVRAAEASDPEAKRWPRNKISDDATVAYSGGN